LVYESGFYKFINNCFNKLSKSDLYKLNQMLDNDYRKPLQYAVKNKLDYKYETFNYVNKFDDQNNTLFHILVEENRMTALRLTLEYAFKNGLLDTIGFGLKNKKNKTCFELAAEIKNSEAIYLLNHYELIDKSLKSNKNSSIIGPSFSIIKDNIEYFKELDKKSIYDPNIINNLIFEGGGVKGIGHVSALKEYPLTLI
jgi:ankyrin repeat protein